MRSSLGVYQSGKFEMNVKAATNTGLVLNVAPIDFDDKEITIGSIEYVSREQLRDLRKENEGIHFFWRTGNVILSVPLVAGVKTLGKPAKVFLSRNLSFTAALIRNTLITYFNNVGRQVLRFDPIEFVASEKDNILAEVAQNSACPDWLSIRPLYRLSARVFPLNKENIFIGLVLSASTRRFISISCKELLTKGIDIVGAYVGQYMSKLDIRIQPKLMNIGKVQSVSNNIIKLTDAREGFNTVDSSQCFLIPSLENFQRCLYQVFRDEAATVKANLKTKLASLHDGREHLSKLKKVVEYLGKVKLQLLPDIGFTIGSFLSQGRQGIFPKVYQCYKPVYIFDPAGRKTNTWHDRGLEQNGPYTQATFTPSKPRVCVICQAKKKGRVEQFLFKFFNGINYQGNGRAAFTKGLVGKYCLDDVSMEFFQCDDDTAEAYYKAVREALAKQRDEDVKWNLALVQIDESFHKRWGADNPYLVTKAAFLGHQIPVQTFEMETTTSSDYGLGFVLNNMALATYAKLGGVPWLIKADPTIAHELVIGLGSACIGQGRLGKRQRRVGITTVFSGDGNYWLSNISQAVLFTDYKKALLDSLKKTINKVRSDMNWQKREHLRLVFHSFKPFRDIEAEVVKETVAELVEYDVDLAFLHVVEAHPFMLFDQKQTGVFDQKSRTTKGILAPNRGQFIQLSNSEVLVILTGANEVKDADDGVPRPIILRLHKNSTFDDLHYLARQAYIFSCHSWRSFFPSPLPVTILYSELIAKLLGQLSYVPQWSQDAMLGRIGKTRWFL